jgi:glucan biosynthesis protein C
MKRIYYLDNLRSFALLLGLVFHTFIVYSSGIGYTVKSQETSQFYTWFVLWVHTFRMPLFFLLSGYFSELLFTKKGEIYFYQSRFTRVGIPILVGLLFFAPVDGYFREIQKTGLQNYFIYLVNFFFLDSFTLSHVWFVYYLLLFTLIYLFMRKALFFLPHFSKIGFYSCLIIGSFASIFIPNLFYTREEFIFQIRPMFFFYYFFFFLVGVYIFQKNLLESIDLTKNQAIFLGILLSISFGIYMYLEEVDQYWMYFLFDNKRIFWRVLHLSLEVILAWGWILLLLTFSRKVWNFENFFTKELSNSLLPVYLFHHPVSIALGYILGNGVLYREIAVILHLFLVISLSLGFYIVVKNFSILSFLFGLKTLPTGYGLTKEAKLSS